MPETQTQTLTIEDLKRDHHDIFGAAFAEGQEAERARLAKLAKVADGDLDLLVVWFTEGATEIQAQRDKINQALAGRLAILGTDAPSNARRR